MQLPAVLTIKMTTADRNITEGWRKTFLQVFSLFFITSSYAGGEKYCTFDVDPEFSIVFFYGLYIIGAIGFATTVDDSIEHK